MSKRVQKQLAGLVLQMSEFHMCVGIANSVFGKQYLCILDFDLAAVTWTFNILPTLCGKGSLCMVGKMLKGDHTQNHNVTWV